ncbi:hypothetical protein NL321_28730, partial [Klebsiella pneumoniae]|nr:hypothetical protein [Klebsiella pneumoniae]
GLALLQAGADLRGLLLDAAPCVLVEVGLLGQALGGGGIAAQHGPQGEVGGGLGVARGQFQRLGQRLPRLFELAGPQARVAEVAQVV